MLVSLCNSLCNQFLKPLFFLLDDTVPSMSPRPRMCTLNSTNDCNIIVGLPVCFSLVSNPVLCPSLTSRPSFQRVWNVLSAQQMVLVSINSGQHAAQVFYLLRLLSV